MFPLRTLRAARAFPPSPIRKLHARKNLFLSPPKVFVQFNETLFFWWAKSTRFSRPDLFNGRKSVFPSGDPRVRAATYLHPTLHPSPMYIKQQGTHRTKQPVPSTIIARRPDAIRGVRRRQGLTPLFLVIVVPASSLLVRRESAGWHRGRHQRGADSSLQLFEQRLRGLRALPRVFQSLRQPLNSLLRGTAVSCASTRHTIASCLLREDVQ